MLKIHPLPTYCSTFPLYFFPFVSSVLLALLHKRVPLIKCCRYNCSWQVSSYKKKLLMSHKRNVRWKIFGRKSKGKKIKGFSSLHWYLWQEAFLLSCYVIVAANEYPIYGNWAVRYIHGCLSLICVSPVWPPSFPSQTFRFQFLPLLFSIIFCFSPVCQVFMNFPLTKLLVKVSAENLSWLIVNGSAVYLGVREAVEHIIRNRLMDMSPTGRFHLTQLRETRFFFVA